MSSQSDAWYIRRAWEQYHHDGAVEIDNNATVSRGEDHRAYVAAWVWVDDPKDDKAREET